MGPPVLTSVEISNNQAEELIRQRREQTQAQQQPVQVAAAAPTPPPAQPTVGGAPAAGTPASSAPAPQAQSSSARPAGTSPPPRTAVRSSQRQPSDPGYPPADPVPAPEGGAWVQVYADFERHRNLAPGSVDNPTRTQRTFGQVAGIDTTYRRGSEALQVGLLGGHSDTRSKFTDTPNVKNASQSDGGGFLGAYGTYQYGQFALDGLFKADFFQHSRRAVVTQKQKSTISCPPANDPTATILLVDPNTSLETENTINALRSGQVPEHNYTVSTNAYYRYELGNGRWFEPTAGIRFTYTDFGFNPGLNIQDGKVLRVQAGARIGGSSELMRDYILTTTLLGLVYSDVWVDGFTLIDTGFVSTVSNVDEGKLRGLAQLNLKLDVGRGVSYGAEVAVRGGEDIWGVGGKLGMRIEW